MPVNPNVLGIMGFPLGEGFFLGFFKSESLLEISWDIFTYVGLFLLAFFLSIFFAVVITLLILPFFKEKMRNSLAEIFLLLSLWPFALYLYFILPYTKTYYLLFALYGFFPTGQFLKILLLPQGLEKALYAFGGGKKNLIKTLFFYNQKEIFIVFFLHFLRISSDFMSFIYLKNFFSKEIFWMEIFLDQDFLKLLVFNLIVYFVSFFALPFQKHKKGEALFE